LRIFLAVFPSPEAQGVAAAVIDRLRGDGDGVSWVKRENLHYTVRFLGELGEDGTRRASEAAAEAVSDHAAFDAQLGALGAFPSARGARVIWAGLAEGAERLVALARSVERALERRGFEREGRHFEAHLTIGRARDPHADWSERLAAGSAVIAAAGAPARFRVDRVMTIHSQLSPRGSVYTVRAEAHLAG
jgi:2'-5' RNA ligase